MLIKTPWKHRRESTSQSCQHLKHDVDPHLQVCGGYRVHWCMWRSDRRQELCENGAAALFSCTANAGGWLCFQRDPECQVWCLDSGLMGVRKRDRECISL